MIKLTMIIYISKNIKDRYKMIDKLYTPQEAAQMLRVTRSTIYQHIKKRQLKAIRIGNQYRITKAQLEEYIRQNVVNDTQSVDGPNGDAEPTII